MGVPVHLWESQVFDTIAASMGKVVARSHATFNGEGGDLIRDTIGIIAEKEWNIQEEISLKWRNKTYTVWCKEDDDGWCKESQSPEKEIPTPKKDLKRHEEHVMTKPGSLEHRPVEEAPAHGGMAQQILNPPGPNPRKRPRYQPNDNDPFLLDAITHKLGKEGNEKSDRQEKFKTPDLNSAMAIPTTGLKDRDEIRETEERFSHSAEGEIRTKDQEGVENEVKATIEMGQMLGINLQNKEELIRMAIQGEGVKIGSP
ncbi:hypothetical protein L1987_43901 [Smallanthus sonchifolius]|uniref:Uncharacterized protein n=1 Tax=Smallanthus sonchifolius TaxID=185202 RepID=A0ACB9GP53_9ASTR|nr:hypothetical protein L1987_43901 [Smallanthus sonchifolius]